jgi:mannose-6-phosphate isomerase
MHLLASTIQPYAWGSRSAIATLQGRPCPTAAPEAELWLGAHPVAPSRLGDGVGLDAALDEHPHWLGAYTRERFSRLPFLLKVLAADTALSIQAHPSLAQAREGFLRENAAGIALTAPVRNYKDDNHKPELLCALSSFEALSGFRHPQALASIFELLRAEPFASWAKHLRAAPPEEALRFLFNASMGLGVDAASRAVAVVVGQAAALRSHSAELVKVTDWIVNLADLYPRDAGVLSLLFLNYVALAPGDAIYLPAGRLHAYLRGTGVEVMANSDNVLRGGLTPKHVDVPELLRVLQFAPTEVAVMRPASGAETTFKTEAPEFELSRIAIDGTWGATALGPEILLPVSGMLTAASGERLAAGYGAFVPAGEAYELCGNGILFRAKVPGAY